MKKWAFMITVCYAALVTTIFVPVFFWLADLISGEDNSFSDYWSLWLLIITGIVVVMQSLLLLCRIPKLKERPKPQRVLWIPAMAAGIMFSLLWLGVIASAAAAIHGDKGSGGIAFFWILGFIFVSWAIWSFLFYFFAKTNNPDSFFSKVMQVLIRGSILELLVALPCHIIVRHKDACCAPGLTFYGIAAGLSVMTIAYGPAVYFIFLKRFSQLQSKKLVNSTDSFCDIVEHPVLNRSFVKIILAVVLAIGICIVYGWIHKTNEKYRMVLQEKEMLEKQVQELKDSASKADEITIGNPFPVLEFIDLRGRQITLKDYQGKTVLIDFWATWCGPCRAETPVLLDLYHRFNKEGFEIIGISLEGTTPVGVFGYWGYGLADMAGNVYEWTQSPNGNYYFIRGGCWTNFHEECLVSNQWWQGPGMREYFLGFRVCR